MARPKGRANSRPSREAISSYWHLLRNAADAGDTQAAAKLIELDHMTRNHQKQEAAR